MEDDDFLDAIAEDNKALAKGDEPKAEAPLELTNELPPEPEQAPEPVAEPQPEPEPEPKPEPQQFAPIGALLDERDKRKALEAELNRLRQSQAQQQPQPIPDMFEDPDGYNAALDQKMQAALYQTNLQWSERIASIQHGPETVSKAKEWGVARCDSDPYFNAKVASSSDPVGFVVAEWQREQIASQVTPDDFAQFQAWKAAQATLQASAPVPPAPPNQPRNVPPRSLASAPSAGGIRTEVEPDEDEIFSGAFRK